MQGVSAYSGGSWDYEVGVAANSNHIMKVNRYDLLTFSSNILQYKLPKRFMCSIINFFVEVEVLISGYLFFKNVIIKQL